MNIAVKGRQVELLSDTHKWLVASAEYERITQAILFDPNCSDDLLNSREIFIRLDFKNSNRYKCSSFVIETLSTLQTLLEVDGWKVSFQIGSRDIFVQLSK